MTDLFNSNTTLPEMEDILALYCLHDTEHMIHAAEDIPLTKKDFNQMLGYLKSFVNWLGDASAYRDVKLTIIVAWIFAEKFSKKDLSKVFLKSVAQLPQHHYRFYMDLLASAIVEFNLDTYSENYDDIYGLINIIHKQAGIL